MASFYVSISADGSSAASLIGAFTGGESSYSYARRIKVTGIGSTKYFTSAESSGGTSTWDEMISGLSSGTTYNWTATLQYWAGGWVDHPSFVDSGSFTTASVTAIHLGCSTGISSFKVTYRNEYNTSVTTTITTALPSYQTIYALTGSSVTWGTVTYETGWSGERWYYNQSGYSYPNVHTDTPDHSITSTYERWCYLEGSSYSPPAYTIGIQFDTGIASIRVKYKNTAGIDMDTTYYANDSIRIQQGSKVTLIATASSPQYRFLRWTIDGSPVYGTSGTLEETPASDETIKAWATANYHYVLTYYKNDGSSPEPSTSEDVYSETATGSTTAIACPWTRDYYTFLYWCTNRTGSGARSEYDPGDSVPISSNLSLYALWSYNYTHRSVDITIGSGISSVDVSYTYRGSSASSHLTSSGTIQVDSGTSVTVTANKSTGYSNVKWTYGPSGGSTTVTSTNPLTITVSSNYTFAASASVIPKYTVTITAGAGSTVSFTYISGETSQSGSVSGNTTTIQVDQNRKVTCSRTISGNYRFKKWQYGLDGGTDTESTAASVEDTIGGAYHFNCITTVLYTISAGVQTRSVRTNVSGSANKSVAESGESVTFTATITNPNYIFEGWYNAADGGTKLSSNASYTHTVTGATSLYVRISFVWTTNIASGEPASIKASDWNELIDFAKLRKSSSATIAPAVTGNSITADVYNSLANVLGVTNKTRGDAVLASCIHDLSNAANAA